MDVPILLSYLVLWALVMFQSLVLLGLTRSLYDLRTRVAQSGSISLEEETLTGEIAPRFEAVAIDGTEVDSERFAGSEAAIVFVSPDCGSCAPTLTELEVLAKKVDGNVLVVCRGDDAGCRALAGEYALNVPVIVDYALEISQRFDVRLVPTAVLINKANRVKAHGHPMRQNELIELADESSPPQLEAVTS